MTPTPQSISPTEPTDIDSSGIVQLLWTIHKYYSDPFPKNPDEWIPEAKAAIELLLLEARKNELTRLLDTRVFEHIIQPQVIQDRIIDLTAQRAKLEGEK